ncbi:MAG: glucose-1-phosphate adenylyltransferase [Parachlamydiaceae bacterium]|nr:glucose-1-phosphate adenylyltransferase [Parachlamydiaceae bacterium]
MPTSTHHSHQSHHAHAKSIKDVATIILGGGRGTRLFPLTKSVSKPALCFGGRYRIIDIPISNALNSGCHQIYVITQFLSSSLHQHIFKTYRMSSFSSGFIELLPAEERHLSQTWFQGTADAVRQNLDYFLDTSAEYFLILSGDQLYNMDFVDMLHFAQKTDADLVIATLPIDDHDAKRMGVLQVDENDFIVSFKEKPQEKTEIDSMRLTKPAGHKSNNSPLDLLGSMGIYLFKRKALIDLLLQDSREDFGKHLIPTKVAEGNAAAYIYKGYWEDIGTIESFHKANLALTEVHPLFDCYNEAKSLYTSPTNLPGAKIYGTKINNSIICEGAIVAAEEITHSILGPRTVVQKGSSINDTYIMGNDSYLPQTKSSRLPHQFQIGENCTIKKAIIDKCTYIGNDVQLINKNNLLDLDHELVYIRDGIIIVPRGTSLPDGFIL